MKEDYEYIQKIEEKNYNNFDSFFESDEYNKINKDETKRKIFYYFALKFSSLMNNNISDLYEDLKKILDKIQTKNYLRKYDEEIYVTIINNYLEKIEVFNTQEKFYREAKNLDKIRDIIKLFNNHFKKKQCPKKIFESLEDLYQIILIKKNHKIREENQKRVDRLLNDYKKLLDNLNKEDNIKLNDTNEKKLQNKEEKNDINNINENNIKQNDEKIFDKFDNFDLNIGSKINIINNNNNNINHNNFSKNIGNNNISNFNIINQDDNEIQLSINNDYNNKISNNNLLFKDNLNTNSIFQNQINDNMNINNNENNNFPNNDHKLGKYKEEGVEFVDIILERNKNNIQNNQPSQDDIKEKEKIFTNEKLELDNNLDKYKKKDNPYKNEKEKDNLEKKNSDDKKRLNKMKKMEKKKKRQEEKEAKFKQFLEFINENDKNK